MYCSLSVVGHTGLFTFNILRSRALDYLYMEYKRMSSVVKSVLMNIIHQRPQHQFVTIKNCFVSWKCDYEIRITYTYVVRKHYEENLKKIHQNYHVAYCSIMQYE